MIRQLFCESLKDYRIENQLTQSDLAKMLGVTKQTVINYENGKTYPREENLKEIESVLDLGMSYFFEMGEHMIENFSINLASLRKQKGLSQKELAQELGISSQTISNIENKSAYPTFTNLEKIAKFFNASPIELIGSQKEIVLSENNNQIIDDVLSNTISSFSE